MRRVLKTLSKRERQIAPHRLGTKMSRSTIVPLLYIASHDVEELFGGARIGCPRAKVSTTIIGAPQCKHQKVGRVDAGSTSMLGASTGTSSCCGSSNSRARASAVLRLPLARSP